jgi:hypothetical protein
MKKTQEMKKVTLYIAAHKHSYHGSKFEIIVDTCDRSKWTHDTSSTTVPLSEVEVEVPIPKVSEKQLLNEEVKQLQAVIQKEKADSHVRITAIEEKIQSLLCIENLSE